MQEAQCPCRVGWSAQRFRHHCRFGHAGAVLARAAGDRACAAGESAKEHLGSREDAPNELG